MGFWKVRFWKMGFWKVGFIEIGIFGKHDLGKVEFFPFGKV